MSKHSNQSAPKNLKIPVAFSNSIPLTEGTFIICTDPQRKPSLAIPGVQSCYALLFRAIDNSSAVSGYAAIHVDTPHGHLDAKLKQIIETLNGRGNSITVDIIGGMTAPLIGTQGTLAKIRDTLKKSGVKNENINYTHTLSFVRLKTLAPTAIITALYYLYTTQFQMTNFEPFKQHYVFYPIVFTVIAYVVLAAANFTSNDSYTPRYNANNDDLSANKNDPKASIMRDSFFNNNDELATFHKKRLEANPWMQDARHEYVELSHG